MAWMGGWFDPELEDLFHGEPELLETARQVRDARPRVEPDPRFQNRLRAQLVAEASRGASVRGVRRWWRLGPAHFAWGGAFVGAALITATVLTFVSTHNSTETVTGISQLTAQHQVSPNQVITVAFNQPMDEQAVVAGVHIEPAVKWSYSWKNNSLVISPAYHLAANTPYVVTIEQTAIRSVSGASATAPINITFGTAPTPTPAPVVPPSLNPVVLGTNGAAGTLLFAPDGSVVSTGGVLPASATTAPSPSPTMSLATPTASATPTPGGVITQAPDVPGALVEYPATGSPTQIGLQASAAAYSPNLRYLATAVDDGSGGSKIFASQSNGQQRDRLIVSATPVVALTWVSNDTIVYTDGTRVVSVDLSGVRETLYSLPAGSGTISALAPGGAYAYVIPATGSGGSLLNISSGTSQQLVGAMTDVAFSGDGHTVAWIDESSTPTRLLIEAVGSQGSPTVVPLPEATASPSDVTLDQGGDEAAYLSTDTAGIAELVVAQFPTGTPLAIGSPTDASQLTLNPGGDELAFISNSGTGANIDLAPVPGARSASTGAQIPPGANATLQQFVQAQVGQNGQPDLATLDSLSVASANGDVESNTPAHLSRAYIINTYLVAGGGVGANIELIVDPNAAHTTARVASETILLAQQTAGGYLVTSASTTQLRDESAGPHVVQVSSTTAGGVTTLQVSFDSDLDAGTVAGAISVTSQFGSTVPSTTVYDADTRTATVTIASAPAGTLTLDIATTLDDYDGQALARSFAAPVGPSS
jgi:hypothetical protein